MSKATPASVQQFSRLGSTSSAHQDQSSLASSSQASTASSSASTSTSFRTPAAAHAQPSELSSSEASTRAQHAWTPSSSGVGTDEDLGRFAAFSSAVGRGAKHQAQGPPIYMRDPGRLGNGNPAPQHLGAETQEATTRHFEAAWSHAQRSPAWNYDDLYYPPRELDVEAGEARNGWQDGDEIQGLLQSGMLNEQLEEGWEQALASDQSRKHHAESTMPKDPATVSATKGHLSPVTQELVQKVDALELETRLHLQSLLTLTNESGHDTLAIQAYLSQESYAEDVWGLPREIRKVLTKVVEEQSQADNSDKNKALERLNMVLKHLQETTFDISTDRGKTNAAPHARGAVSDDEGDSYGSALQHVAARRSSQLGPKHSSAMSTPPNGLVQDRAHDFAALHERIGRGGAGREGR